MKNVLLILSLFSTSIIFAQNKTVNGKVSYEQEPIAGATISLTSNDYSYQVISEEDGSFSIAINDVIQNYTIAVEHIFFETVTKKYNYVERQSVTLLFTTEKTEAINEIVIDATAKTIRRFADKTIIDVENMSVLNNGTVFEAINKLPGVLVTANGQIAHNGKLAIIFLDGEPTGMSGEQLTNFLKNLPAHSVKNIEIIDNPGAKYSATFNGTIINVVTKSAKISGLSGSVMQNNSINSKVKNTTSAQLMWKRDKITWNVNMGYTHHEGVMRAENEFSYVFEENTISALEKYWTKSFGNNVFLRNNWQYKISDQANVTLKYNYGNNYNRSFTNGSMINGINDLQQFYYQVAKNRSKSNSHDVQFVYTQKLDTIGTQFTVTSINQWILDGTENQLLVQDQLASQIGTKGNVQYSQTKFDFERPLLKWKGSLGVGAHYTDTKDNNQGYYIWEGAGNYIPYEFQYTNKAAYATLSTTVKKLMLTAGLRYENLTYHSRTAIDSLNYKSTYDGIFPTVTLKYPLVQQVAYLTAGYSKRMNLPSTSAFNPNVTSRNSLLVSDSGNPYLEPEINHNINASLSVFDFIYFSYNYSRMPKQNAVFYELTDTGGMQSKTHTLRDATSQSFNMGFPIPYAMFTKGLKTMINDRNAINPDELSFTYFNTGYFKTAYEEVIPERFQKGSFYIFTYSQFYLKNNLRLYVIYYNMFKGVMNLYELNKPSQNLNVSINKKFMDNKMSLTLGVDNILNTDGFDVNVFGNGMNMRSQTMNERRMFKFGFTYNFGGFKDQNQQMFPQQTVPFK